MQLCATTATTSTSFNYAICDPSSYTSISFGSVPELHTVGVDGFTSLYTISSLTLFAPLIQLNQQASSTIPSQTLFQTSSTEPSAATTSSSLDTSTTGLSSGVKIALGVALPLSLICIAFLSACIWFRRRRRQKQQAAVVAERAELDDAQLRQKELAEMPNNLRYEAPAKENAVEVSGDHAPEVSALRSPVELDGKEAIEVQE